MSATPAIRVLLVEDDEDDFMITQELLAEISCQRFQLDWAKNYDHGLESMTRNQHDIVLVDYRLGGRNGIQLLSLALQRGCTSPIILLTGLSEHLIDVEAMKAGAADYLVKDRLDADALERSIRYALQRKRAAQLAAADQARLAAFGTEVGLALTRQGSLDSILDSCARSMVQYLGARLAEISIYNPNRQAFEQRAVAYARQKPKPAPAVSGAPEDPTPEGEHEHAPLAFRIQPSQVAERQPVLIRQILEDDRIWDREWARAEDIECYAGYALFLENKLVGLMSLFTAHGVTDQIGQEMGSVANGIALCIERKRSEEALDASESKYLSERKLAETAIQKLAAFPRVNPNPVLEFAADGSLNYANDAAWELAKSLKKQEVLHALPENTAELVRECLRQGENKLRQEVTHNERTISWSFFPIPGSQVVHCYGTDVTEVLSLEAQFRHAQKLECVGQLAAGVAHDFNNILTIIQGYAEHAMSRCTDPSLVTPLKQISASTHRAAALTRQLLLFSRKRVMQPKIVDLNAVLADFANMLPRLLREDITLKTEHARCLPRIEADRGMLEQIVMNLAVNARDAMPNGGELRMTTCGQDIAEDYTRHHPDARTGSFVCVTVTDTGCGMDRKTLDRIFEPFFSTKEVGKGTGLGLATVYGIVKQHQGWIEVVSEPGQGTSFRIFFPAAAPAELPAGELPAASERIEGGKETILLVEDEPVVRELVSEVLLGYQYRVLQASSGVEALRVWEEHGGQIDLLFTDMVMPEGMTGRDLAHILKQRKPELRVIYTSGYSTEMMGKDFANGDTAFLCKPYVPPELARMIRLSLDSPPGNTSNPAAS